MKIILFGANGQLGKSFQHHLSRKKNIKLYSYTKNQVNILNESKLKNIAKKIKPKFIINCAAYTVVDQCEKNKKIANLINYKGVKNISLLCKKLDITLIHFSTDYVYDGKKSYPYNENDKTNPINIYGQSKLKGENVIIKNNHKYFIIRLSWLFSKYDNSNFVNFIKKNFYNKKNISVIDDQYGRPTNCDDVVKLVLKIIYKHSHSNEINGIYNYSSSGPKVSWYQYSKKIIKILKVIKKDKSKRSFISNISQKRFNFINNLSTKRPKYSVLDYRKVKKIFQYSGIDWRISLENILKSDK